MMKYRKNLVRLGLCLGLAGLTAGPASLLPPAAVYAEDYSDVFYEGIADGKVNVRVGAGEDNERVTHGGENVQLKAGERVTIIGEEMVGKKVWYKVRFMRGEDEIVGFCTSSYVTKTSKTISPTPAPTPTPEPTPTSEPTPEPSATPEPSPSPTAGPASDSKEDKPGLNGGIIAAIIVVIVAGGALVFLKSQKTQAANRAASRKMAQLKKLKLEEGMEEEEDDNSRGRRKPEVRTKSNIHRETQAEQVYQDVYVKKTSGEDDGEYAYVSQGNSEEIKISAARESAERKALRDEIENLREHDLVIHKYFGRGEVYDNSDVRLIEVRFGGDVRFMNKDALAAKKLMKRCSDDMMRYHRRTSERPGHEDYYD